MATKRQTPPPNPDLTARITQAVEARGGKPQANGEIRFSCPAHDDEHPSADWNPTKGVWKCLACGVGGGYLDLAKRLEVALPSTNGTGARETRYRIEDPTEQGLRIEHVRKEPKDFSWWINGETRKGIFRQHGLTLAALPLYRVETLRDLPGGEPVIVTEGEKAADALAALGVAVVGTACGASTIPSVKTLAPLVGRAVCLWADNDEAGRDHMDEIAKRLARAGCTAKLIQWGEREKDDAADFVERGGTVELLHELMDAAEEWQAPEKPDLLVTSPPDFSERTQVTEPGPAPRPDDVKLLLGMDPPTTDLHFAQGFAALAPGRIAFCRGLGWWVFDGQRWVPEDDAPGRHLHRLANTLLVAASHAPEHLRRAYAEAAVKAMKGAILSGVLIFARGMGSLRVAPEALDADPFLLNLQNGTIDLRTRERHPHRPEDLLTKIAGVSFDPMADCPKWYAFLNRIFGHENEIQDFFSRWLGYCLSADTREDKVLVEWGSGCNGKTCLDETVKALLGDYAIGLPVETLVQARQKDGSAPAPDVLKLRGARLCFLAEFPEGGRLAENKLKVLSGGDSLSARGIHEKHFVEWLPTHKLCVRTNHKPVIRGTDTGIWRRIALLPFTQEIPEAEQRPRPEVIAELVAEGPGILRWMLAGCREWLRNGLKVPDTVKDATQEYREEQDIIGEFLRQRTLPKRQGKVSAADLYAAFTKWCEDGGEYVPTQQVFGMKLSDRGFERQRGTGGRHEWHGLLLVE